MMPDFVELPLFLVFSKCFVIMTLIKWLHVALETIMVLL